MSLRELLQPPFVDPQTLHCRRIPDTSRLEQRCPLPNYHHWLYELLPRPHKQPLRPRHYQVSPSVWTLVWPSLIWSRNNANAALVFEFIYRFISIAKSYFGKVDEEAVKSNFVLIYELIDGALT